MPADLQKAIDDYLEGIRAQVTYLDCLADELYGSINANQWGWDISKEQADYLRAKYLFEPEDEAEDFHQTQSWSATPLSDKTGQRLFCAQQHGPGEPLLAPVWPGEAVFSPRWENDPAQAPKSRIRPCVGKVVKSPNIASKGGVKKEQVKG